MFSQLQIDFLNIDYDDMFSLSALPAKSRAELVVVGMSCLQPRQQKDSNSAITLTDSLGAIVTMRVTQNTASCCDGITQKASALHFGEAASLTSSLDEPIRLRCLQCLPRRANLIPLAGLVVFPLHSDSLNA